MTTTSASPRPLAVMRVVLAALLAAGALALAQSAEAAPDRPRITSFYVRDEGATIHFRVKWCVPRYALGNSIISTFRLWDPDGYLLMRRRVSGRANTRCATDSLRLPDRFANGIYAASGAVADRTDGGFIRLAARDFRIS